jgi:hypothetical protein
LNKVAGGITCLRGEEVTLVVKWLLKELLLLFVATAVASLATPIVCAQAMVVASETTAVDRIQLSA